MLVVVAKVVLAPVLVGMATLIVRRWGQAAGGWLLGLPIVSGPTSVLLCAEHGPGFARAAAQGTLLGLVAGGAFCLTYALLARGRAWWKAMAVAVAVCIAVAWCLSRVHAGTLPDAGLAAVALGLVAHGLRGTRRATAVRPSPTRSVAARMALAGIIVVAITTAAPILGSRMSGILTPLPVISALMAISLHRRSGGEAARGLLGGVAASSWGAAAFFLVVAALMSHTGPLNTYLLAAIAAVAATLLAIVLQARRGRMTAACA